MSHAIETATLEYDDAGNAFVRMEGADEASSTAEPQEHGGGNAAGVPASPLVRAQLGYPATPGSALSDPDVSAQLARLLEEREDLRCRVEEQKAQIDQRLAEHLQTASQREQHFAQQLRAATDREQARVDKLRDFEYSHGGDNWRAVMKEGETDYSNYTKSRKAMHGEFVKEAQRCLLFWDRDFKMYGISPYLNEHS